MLLILTIFSSLLFFCTQSFSTWTPANVEITPIDTSNQYVYSYFVGVDCADSLNCIAITNERYRYRVVYQTTDAGKNWEILYKPDYGNKGKWPLFKAISYPSLEKCLIGLDSGVIIITNDRGKTWSTINTPLYYNQIKYPGYLGIKSINMLDSNYGIANSGFYILFTNDGGNTWKLVNKPDSSSGVYDAVIVSPSKLIYYGSCQDINENCPFSRTIFISNDTGNSWKGYDFTNINTTENIYGGTINLFFKDSLNGWAVGGDPNGIGDQQTAKIAATSDGGKTWNMQFNKIIYPNTELLDVSFHDNYKGIAVGWIEEILKSTNGGIDWFQDYLPIHRDKPYVGKLSVCYRNVKNPIVVGSPQGIFYYSDETHTIENQNYQYITIYPNPVSNLIKFKFNYANKLSNINLKIFDIFGNEIKSIPYPATDKENSEINVDISGLQAGVYFIKSVIGGKVEIAKFVKVY